MSSSRPKSTSESSNIKVLSDSKKNIKSKEDLQIEVGRLSELAAAQHLQVERLTETIREKDQEIKHLQTMLQKAVPLLGGSGLQPLTDEEEVAMTQLEFLKHTAKQRQLTLDETRMFDILVKNKRLSQGKPTVNTASERINKLSANELISLASTKIKKNE